MNAWEVRSDGGIDALVATERPAPAPGPRELVVRVRAVSLNYRDLLHVLGYADRDRWPLVPCSDGAGEVVAIGRDVTRFRVGDRVAGTFFQGWDAGRITAGAMETALGGRLQGMKQDWLRELAPVAESDRQPMRAERVMAELERVMGASTLLVTDASYSSGWAMSQIGVPLAGRFILSPRGTASVRRS